MRFITTPLCALFLFMVLACITTSFVAVAQVGPACPPLGCDRLPELCGGPLIACCNREDWYDETYCCINDYYSQRVRFCEDTTNPCLDLDAPGNFNRCCETGVFSEREPWEQEACCAKQFDVTKCCAIEPWYGDDKRCPFSPEDCNYTETPERCCERFYDKTKCCSFEPNGFYDTHHCCAEEDAIYFDEDLCTVNPLPCDFKATRQTCCERANLFDPVLCCDATTTFYDPRCCDLGAPYFVQAQCPETCPTSGTEPCVEACNYNDPEKRADCCASQFIHTECCHLPGHDAIQNDFYLLPQCCAAFPHDFREDKCCPLPEYTTDARCVEPPCDYIGTAAEIEACCVENFDLTQCCTATTFPTDRRCPPPPCDYAATPAECCQQIFDVTQCCAKTEGGYYDDECCFEQITSEHYDPTKCPLLPLSCWNQAGSTPALCCETEFFASRCCDASTATSYYNLEKCCALSTPYYVEAKCLDCPAGSSVPCNPPCDYSLDRDACCKLAFDHHKCCDSQWHELPDDYYLTPQCCAIITDFNKDICCILEAYETDPRCVSEPCDYVGTVEEIIACCDINFSAEECCVFEVFHAKPECRCTYIGTPEVIKTCCDKQWDAVECCKLTDFQQDPRCIVNCAEITDETQLLACCQQTAPQITPNCCAFPEFAVNPICPCDYNTNRATCCARPDGFVAAECCSIAPYKDNAELCPPEPGCNYVTTPATCCTENDGAGFNKMFCCGQYGFYDVNKCCKLEPPFSTNSQCPPPPQPPCQRKCSTTQVTNVNIHDITSKKDTVIHIRGGHSQHGRPHKKKHNTIIHHDQTHRGL